MLTLIYERCLQLRGFFHEMEDEFLYSVFVKKKQYSEAFSTWLSAVYILFITATAGHVASMRL
jgi:hypothetical protein